MKASGRSLWRLFALLVPSLVALQLYFLARVALMVAVDPESTSFQRSEAWRLVRAGGGSLDWSAQWTDRISPQLGRAVIASEDANFVHHHGIEWGSVEHAMKRNERAETAAARTNERLSRQAAARAGRTAPAPKPAVQPKIVGGSTISQQLAKNLFLSGERTLLRKAQEVVLTYELETLLGKRRILQVYLNDVEWGEGVFGAEAAARHYFHVDAAQLGTAQAARLAVMLPAPKRFEQHPGSAYVLAHAGTVAARMPAVTVP